MVRYHVQRFPEPEANDERNQDCARVDTSSKSHGALLSTERVFAASVRKPVPLAFMLGVPSFEAAVSRTFRGSKGIRAPRRRVPSRNEKGWRTRGAFRLAGHPSKRARSLAFQLLTCQAMTT